MVSQDFLRPRPPDSNTGLLGSIGSSPFFVGNSAPAQQLGTAPITTNNPFNLQDLEGTDIGRRTIFEQARPDFLRTGQQRDIFSSLFQRTLNDFLGELGRDFSVGRPPAQSFTDFVNSRDFDRQIRREGVGRGVSGLVGPANFLFRT